MLERQQSLEVERKEREVSFHFGVPLEICHIVYLLKVRLIMNVSFLEKHLFIFSFPVLKKNVKLL